MKQKRAKAGKKYDNIWILFCNAFIASVYKFVN